MKLKIFVFMILVVIFSMPVIAQTNDISFSIGVPFISISRDFDQSVDNDQFIEFGLNLNIMFFKNSDFGYYINMYGLFNLDINDDNGIVDLYFGIIPGIGYRKIINDNLSFFGGIGPAIIYDIIDLGETDITRFGIGIGGTLEIRLQLYKNFNFAGGVLIDSNFSNKMSRNINIHPYIGFSWN